MTDYDHGPTTPEGDDFGKYSGAAAQEQVKPGDDRLFVLEERMRHGKRRVCARSLVNSWRSPWVLKEHMADCIAWGERHGEHQMRSIRSVESIAAALNQEDDLLEHSERIAIASENIAELLLRSR